jgi:YrbI family 3-deoxy-D-manno-octulosonate 8-phosphate phosphatase
VTSPAADADLAASIRRVRLVVFDFDGVFTDNAVWVFQDGTEAVRCSRADGLGLRKLERAGIGTMILSTETNPVVTARARKLKIDCVQSCEDKRVGLETILEQRGLSLSQVAFVGNDINDACCLTEVGLPIVVADAHPDVLPYARYKTRALGGHGAVREVCDLFERVLSAPVGAESACAASAAREE